ncbi:hypothetical protein H1Q63_09925 [Desmonostoc muscorum CCALA 125]|nr:hypothetical protein [Desmonostoc muscorum CCALA 125]
MNPDVETLHCNVSTVALQRLYKDFDIMHNRFHTSNQQRQVFRHILRPGNKSHNTEFLNLK